MSELPDAGASAVTAATGAWPPPDTGRPGRTSAFPGPPRPAPPAHLPPAEAELLSRARTTGALDGRSGVVDQWSFDPATRPGYVMYLRGERELAVTCAEQAATADEAARAAAATTAHSELAAVTARVRRLWHEARDAAQQVMRARARIDRQARLDAHVRDRRLRYDPGPPAADELTDPDRIWVEDAFRLDDGVVLEPEPADGAPEEVTGTGVPDGTTAERDTGPDSAATPDGRPAGGAAEGDRWEGPYTDRIPDRWIWVILTALILVELPIQGVIFDYFHDRSVGGLLLTGLFTLSVASVMVLGPHVVGRLYRSRQATGTGRLLPAMSLALLAPCVPVLFVLGDLRRRVLLVEQVTPDENGNPLRIETRIGALHLTPTTISVMFVSLLLITAGISFLLGLAREHPWQIAYGNAERDRRFLCGELERAIPVLHQARQRARVCTDETAGGAQRRQAEIRRVHAMYAAAELAYLDGVAEGLADPAASQAIARLAEALRDDHRAAGISP